MDATGTLHPLPASSEPELHLTNPTATELDALNRLTFAEWGDALTLTQFLEECDFLTDIPLARDGGMVSWILTHKNKPENQRPLLASCETIRKRAFVSSNGSKKTQPAVADRVMYGIASVFVNPAHRNQGYGRRLMQELARVLSNFPTESPPAIGSILYSDIGVPFYKKLGWPAEAAATVNFHLEFPLPPAVSTTKAVALQEDDLPQLCQDDEAMIRRSLVVTTSPPGKPSTTQFAIIPDVDHLLWHINKETFACTALFGDIPTAKGAIAGSPGSRVWAVWARRYYTSPLSPLSPPSSSTSSSEDINTLYILRFVLENPTPATDLDPKQLDAQIDSVRAVLQAAQAEAEEWKLACVKLWHPSPVLLGLIDRTGVKYRRRERVEESVACLRWVGEGQGQGQGDARGEGVERKGVEVVEWVACERYAWL